MQQSLKSKFVNKYKMYKYLLFNILPYPMSLLVSKDKIKEAVSISLDMQ